MQFMRRALASCAAAALALIIAATTLHYWGTLYQSDDPTSLNKRATELYKEGNFSEGIPLAERYAEAISSRHGTEAPQYGTALNSIALLYRAQGRYAEAEPLFKRSLAIEEKAFGSDH